MILRHRDAYRPPRDRQAFWVERIIVWTGAVALFGIVYLFVSNILR